MVVLDSLPIILQRAALTKAAVLNSLLLHLALLNSLSPALLHIGMQIQEVRYRKLMLHIASNILIQEVRCSPAKDASMMP